VFAQGVPIPNVPSGDTVGLAAAGTFGLVAEGTRAGGVFEGEEFGVTALGKRGAIFEADLAQISLKPANRRQQPATGNLGDLLFIGGGITDTSPQLWLCTTSSSGPDSPAFWQSVQLGPPIQGQG
jgi:hypothetical protein